MYDSLIPSLFRKCKRTSRVTGELMKVIKRVINDKKLSNDIKVSIIKKDSSLIKVEGMMQHYGIPTRYLDLVDNHWVALWMGNNKYEQLKAQNEYSHFVPRVISFQDVVCKSVTITRDKEEFYQYILLLSIPYALNNNEGISISNDYILVDLRQALPSVFLRPHAQHGLVVRKKVDKEKDIKDYDLSQAVVGVLKLRIDHVSNWLGDGLMLTQNNLFPPPCYDCGYDLLLSRKDIFDTSRFSVLKYL